MKTKTRPNIPAANLVPLCSVPFDNTWPGETRLRWIADSAQVSRTYPALLAQAQEQMTLQAKYIPPGMKALDDPNMQALLADYNTLAKQCWTRWAELRGAIVHTMPDVAKRTPRIRCGPYPWHDHGAGLIKEIEQELDDVAVEAENRAVLGAAEPAAMDKGGRATQGRRGRLPKDESQAKRIAILALMGDQPGIVSRPDLLAIEADVSVSTVRRVIKAERAKDLENRKRMTAK